MSTKFLSLSILGAVSAPCLKTEKEFGDSNARLRVPETPTSPDKFFNKDTTYTGTSQNKRKRKAGGEQPHVIPQS